MIKSVPFFQNIHPKIVADLVVNLGVEVYLKGDWIVNCGEQWESMYFIYRGICDVIIPTELNFSKEKMPSLLDSEMKSPNLTKATERRTSPNKTTGSKPTNQRRKSSILSKAFPMLPHVITGIKETENDDDDEDEDSESASEEFTSGRSR